MNIELKFQYNIQASNEYKNYKLLCSLKSINIFK